MPEMTLSYHLLDKVQSDTNDWTYDRPLGKQPIAPSRHSSTTTNPNFASTPFVDMCEDLLRKHVGFHRQRNVLGLMFDNFFDAVVH